MQKHIKPCNCETCEEYRSQLLSQQQLEVVEKVKEMLKTDYPTAWEVLKTRPDKHHEKCSWRTASMLCDCAGVDVFKATMSYFFQSLSTLNINK